ncbi:DUF3047 domain-containing protein [Photobacterium sp. SDRW27]|uniref:DUF3047 domain-containing protein n=1 Tax=Photobacterium obscurum TaxID=2829490 RepID=UPI002244F202|nr:DUF3047 domain-containing protein [Photobacterium obscurum]MCW8328404.1 DUF3047 domain-containing protein [Photobacterium obscurum]
MKPYLCLALGLLYFYSANTHTQYDIHIANFATESLSRWQAKSFIGMTQYDIVDFQDRRVLRAHSLGTASGLVKTFRVDLKKTPYLNWSWRVENTLPHLNEKTKNGDDYVARIYIVKSGGWQRWKTKALNYVWSSNQAIYSRWNNAFAGSNAKMLAVRGKKDLPKQWQQEKRNVYQDFINAFGDKGSRSANEAAYRYIDAVAIMTDTDNSQLEATAYYGNIYFSEK